MQAPFLIGDAIYLRALERADAPALQAIINHPEVNATLAAWRPQTLESEADYLERMGRSETDLVLGIAVRADDSLVGVTGLHAIDWRNRSAGFGIAIGGPGEWGKGYGTEGTRLVTGWGFERLNLHRIWLDVYAPNERGIRAYERVGYRREGVLRESVFRGGAYRDTYRMAMLASEWAERRGR